MRHIGNELIRFRAGQACIHGNSRHRKRPKLDAVNVGMRLDGYCGSRRERLDFPNVRSVAPQAHIEARADFTRGKVHVRACYRCVFEQRSHGVEPFFVALSGPVFNRARQVRHYSTGNVKRPRRSQRRQRPQASWSQGLDVPAGACPMRRRQWSHDPQGF